jgi:hypothetical protein
MDQLELGRLAAELAPIAAAATPAAAEAVSKRIRAEAPRFKVAHWTLAHAIAAEWVRQGMVPAETLVEAMR